MADVPERAKLGRAAVIAIGFAVVALATSVAAVLVVTTREVAPVAVPVPVGTVAIERAVEAAQVSKLKRDVVERATDGGGSVIGVRIKEDSLRSALGLEPGDVIAAIGGREIKREFDVYDAVLGISMMDASIIYVDVVRATQPVLLRWKLEGELRSTRRDPAPPRPTRLSPSPPPPADPLLDTITKVGDLEYEVPRSTVDRLLANPLVYARQARIVPAMRSGKLEGFRLFAVAPGSVFGRIGLASGDLVRTINGHDVGDAGGFDVYPLLKDSSKLEIAVTRRGAGGDQTITITVK
jgi:general secretion pathway protein C